MPIGPINAPPVAKKEIYQKWGAPQWERDMGQEFRGERTAEFMQGQGIKNFDQRLYEPTADRNLGYRPTVWQDPRTVARAYQQIQSTVDPAQLPQWLQDSRPQIEFAYKWFEDQNGGTPFAEWKFLAPDDPVRETLGQMQAPPVEWLNPEEANRVLPDYVKAGQAAWNDLAPATRKALLLDPTFDITQYPQAIQGQILSDPNFDWSRVPEWQKTYYDLSSNPTSMGVAQGALMGLGGGPVGSTIGAAAGGLLGGFAAWSGYDPTKEFWQQGDNKFSWDWQQLKDISRTLFGMMNWPVEQVEKTLGLMKQVEGALKDPENFGTVGEVFQNLPAAYEAGGAYFEQMPAIFGGKDYVLGRADPIERPRIYQTLKDIRDRVINGESGRQVVQEYQGYIGGQLSDLVLQAAADPMNFLPDASNKVAAKVAESTGNPVWAEAFRSTEAPFEAARKYQTLVQTGEAFKIDPNFRVDSMGGLSRFIAGINEQGQIKAGPFNEAGLLDAPKKMNWLQEQATLTPEARAQISAGMFYENIGSMLSMFDDPTEAAKYIKGLAKNDMTQWADMGARFANSPEMYTVLPAIRDFASEKVDALTSAWEMTAPNRDTLVRVADVLGQEPAKLLDDLASKGTAEQDFARIVERLKQQDTPQARALLDEVNSGRFNSQILADTVKAFTGDAALPWHPNQWKALMLDQLGAHFDQWVVDRLGLKDTPEAKNAFFRLSKVMKSAQSILLLGGSPGYAIQNGLSNMVHRAATGIFGYLTPGQIDGWMERFGVTPARMDEGVGIGGEVLQAPDRSSVHTEAIRDAARSAGGPISHAQDMVSKLGKAMPFNKLSGWFETTESRQGFAIAMRDFWSQSWRRGKGFSRMSPELDAALKGAGYNPDHVYAAIEAGMNQTEIEQALFGQQAGIQARTLVHDAAQRAGIPSSEAAHILEKVGVLDALDNLLVKADKPEKVQAAFRRAMQRAQDEIDMTYTRDLTARTEFIAQKSAAEGATAILDAVVDTSMPYIDTWLEHYARMGNLWDNLDNTMGEDFNLKVIESAYQQSDQAFRRVNSWQAATWQGILKNAGILESDFGRTLLGSLAESDKALSEAYRFMLDEKRAHIEKHGKNPTAREAKGDWIASQKRVNKAFDDAFAVERRSNEAMRDGFTKYYTETYGPAAGEVARQMWQDVIDFRKQMTDALKNYRDGNTLGMNSRDFYQNIYTPMIVEMGRIKQEGQAKLYQAVTGRMLPAEVAQLSQQAQVRVQTEAANVSALWDVAEEYSKMQPGNSGRYSRAAFQDKGALLGVLKKEEYGGDPTITDLTDATRKLTPEKVREIFETRKGIKEQTFAAAEAERQVKLRQVFEENKARAANRKTPENTTVLQAIKKHGGIDWQYIEQITGEKTAQGFPPGTFSKNGKMRWALDQMARLLADDGYPIDINDPNDLGGINQTIELIRRARNGEKVYTVGHDYSIETEALAAAESAAAEMRAADILEVNDMQAWSADVQDAAARGDFNTLADLIERLPEDVQNLPHTEGETFAEYASRTWDEAAARIAQEQTDLNIAEANVRAADAVAGEQAAGNTAMTRQMFREKLGTEFGLSDAEADAVLDITDGRAKGWAALNKRTPDEWYSTHLADVVKGGEGFDLTQGIEPINRRMTQDEVSNYARALVRAGKDELRRAVQNEPSRADRVAILDAAHQLDARMAESVARDTSGMLFQEAYHGSPYKFDKFSLDHMGSGEGAQAYGWGLYFADRANVAEWYRKTLAPDRVVMMIDGSENTKVNISEARGYTEVSRRVNQYGIDADLGIIRGEIRNELSGLTSKDATRADVLKSALSFMDNHQLDITGMEQGQLYRVEIPDENYLLWDKPLSEQPQAVKDALIKGGYEIFKSGDYEAVKKDGAYYDNGEAIYNLLKQGYGTPKGASLALKDAGINGIKYLDGNSRSAGDGNYNYVIFDDQAVQVLETYYQGEGSAKGAVQFLDDGRAIIRAFDGGDVSTVVHEVGHIFRRDLAGADLRIIEDWAEVKDGTWTRDAEEKFARGFERYLAEGNAPTPRLKQVFEKFKTWLTNIYKSITGSAIDINLTDDVRAVFARLIDEQGMAETRPTMDTARVEAEVQKVRQARQGTTLFQKAAPVETPEFRAWFGDSKVVDENGQPLVVYHGTRADFSQFDKFNFFTEDKNYAGEISKGKFWDPAPPDGAKVLPVYLKMENPYIAKLKDGEFSVPSKEKPIIEKALSDGYDGVVFVAEDGTKYYVTFNSEQIKSTANRGTFDPNNPNILFQDATQPPGAYDQAADMVPTGPVLDEGWQRYVRPLMDAMQETATERLNTKQLDGARDLSPEGQAMLRQYMKRVQGEMATTKLTTIRWGEKQRDFAMLNYNRRYGFDRTMETFFPYQFFYTHSMLPWAMRAIDKPSWFMNYARLRNQQNRYERDIPERLRNKIKIPAPWLPDWMGDALYIDPLANLFTPANYLRPFEQMNKDKNMQMIEAERILQEWSADGTVSEADIQAAMTHEGATWERALAEAGIRREAEIANPFDFFRTTFGPAWYISTPLNLAGIKVPGLSTGKRSDVTNTPLANTARAVDTVTNGTWAEPIGNVLGLLGKPEEWARQKLGLPEFGEYGDYYIDRQLANMVAEGLANPQDAQVAMIERTGPLFEQAQERVKMELAMRVPLAGATYAATHEGIGAAAQAFLPSLFGAGLLPAGELEYRGLKQVWNDAWTQYDAGDKEAITRFFDDHPEYEVYLAKGKEPEERLRSFLIGQIWDGYMGLGPTDQRAARLAMGDEFSQAFLNKETRSYDTMDVQKLATWARMLNMLTPRTEQTAPVLDNPDIQPVPTFDPNISKVTDKFFNDRKTLFPNYYALQSKYYNLPRSEQGAFLLRYPELRDYLAWKKQYYKNYPDLVPIFNGEAFKTIDTTAWPPALVNTATMYAITGDLPSGARDMLKIIWLREGMPMGDFTSWLENQVAPSMLNSQYR